MELFCATMNGPVPYTEEEIAQYQRDQAAEAQRLVALNRQQLKDKRSEAVANIKVTVGDKTFDGDENSQTRMARAILIAQATGLTSTAWTLADNSVSEVSVPELTQALALAGQRQAELWPLPTP